MHLARWDLDKTYLRTEFDTMRDLMRTALEKAQDKKTHPGAKSLVKALLSSGSEIHILSGSPEQMRKKLEKKLYFDGIEWKSFVLKPNLKNALRLRFRAMRDQLGYKLPELLYARNRLHLNAEHGHVYETLFGDDAEADAFVYVLYKDILSGALDMNLLEQILVRGRVYPDRLLACLNDAKKTKKEPAVERILIHLEKQSDPEHFHIYGASVVPFYNYFQAALVVYLDHRIDAHGLISVAEEMMREHFFSETQLLRSISDLWRRGHIPSERKPIDWLEPLVQSAHSRGEIDLAKGLSEGLLERPSGKGLLSEKQYEFEEVQDPLPYLELVDKHNPRQA